MLQIPTIAFDSLYKKSKFEALKRKFLENDIYRPQMESQEINLDWDTIQYKVSKVFLVESIIDENTQSISDHYQEDVVDIVTLDFFKNFLKPAIANIPENFEHWYHLQLESKGILFAEGAENNFARELKEMALTEVDKIQDANAHLSQEIIDFAVEHVFKCVDFLEERIHQQPETKKIPFNLRRNQLIGLFYSMYKEGIIGPGIDPLRLGNLMQNYFLFKGGKSLKRVYQELNLYQKADPKAKSGPPHDAYSELTKIKNELSSLFINIF